MDDRQRIENKVKELLREIKAGEGAKQTANELIQLINSLQKNPTYKASITVTDENGNTYSQSISKIKGGKLTAAEKSDLLNSIAHEMGIDSLQEIETLDFDFSEMDLTELDSIADLNPLDLDFDL